MEEFIIHTHLAEQSKIVWEELYPKCDDTYPITYLSQPLELLESHVETALANRYFMEEFQERLEGVKDGPASRRLKERRKEGEKAFKAKNGMQNISKASFLVLVLFMTLAFMLGKGGQMVAPSEEDQVQILGNTGSSAGNFVSLDDDDSTNPNPWTLVEWVKAPPPPNPFQVNVLGGGEDDVDISMLCQYTLRWLRLQQKKAKTPCPLLDRYEECLKNKEDVRLSEFLETGCPEDSSVEEEDIMEEDLEEQSEQEDIQEEEEQSEQEEEIQKEEN